MFRNLSLALALASSVALPLATQADAAMSDGAFGARQALAQTTPIEQAQFFFGGRSFCWYLTGWHGPGWYWCGYAGAAATAGAAVTAGMAGASPAGTAAIGAATMATGAITTAIGATITAAGNPQGRLHMGRSPYGRRPAYGRRSRISRPRPRRRS